jgi:hypothetical protein
VVQISDKVFVPNRGMGMFKFDLNENELINILDSNDIPYKKEQKEGVVEYFLEGGIHSVNIFFHYENSNIDYLSIHTSDLLLDDISIGNVSGYDELMEVIQEYHNKKGIEFKYTTSDMVDELFVDFENIGLSVWFEDKKVSDICVMPTEC